MAGLVINHFFQSPTRTYYPVPGNITNSYYTLEPSLDFRALEAQQFPAQWNVFELISECVDRDQFHLTLHVSCAVSYVGKFCTIAKKVNPTPCDKSSTGGFNTIYFFDDPTGTVFGGIYTVNVTCSPIQGTNSASCTDGYTIDYGQLSIVYNNIIALLRTRTICLTYKNVPKFTTTPEFYSAMAGLGIAVNAVGIALAIGGLIHTGCKEATKQVEFVEFMSIDPDHTTDLTLTAPLVVEKGIRSPRALPQT